jgi:DNA-binding NarL/FixJ family response regulator
LREEGVIKVAIVDDQRLFVDGLSIQPDVEVVGRAHTGEEAVEMCLREEPDVVLMDLSMPGMGGIRATRKILSLLPGTQVLVLTVHTDDINLFQAIKAGAQGYILKDCAPEDLASAIKAVHAGDTIMSPDIAKKTMTTFEGIRSSTELAPSLTERELDLGISEKTVRNHTSNIYRKLHIFDRTQAVIYAVRRGLVDLEQPELP